MTEESRYFRLGLFMLIGIAITVGMILLIGGSGLFEERVLFETYIDESVQGLDVGSPVKLRGVSIGAVSEIGFVSDYYDVPGEQVASGRSGNQVVVRMEVNPRLPDSVIFEVFGEGNAGREFIEELIEDGMRLQVASLGLTGTAYMSADYVDSERYPPMEISWQPVNYYVPSAPSTFKALSTAAERVFDRLEKVDVETIAADVGALIATLKEQAADVEIAALQGEAVGLLSELRETNTRIQHQVLGDDADASVVRIDNAVDELRALLIDLRNGAEAVRYDLTSTLSNLRLASEDLREITGSAREYPARVIFGDPPPPGPKGGAR